MALSNLVYIDANGYHYPDYPTVLTWYQDQYKAIFGADIYIDPDSQDGQLLALYAISSYDMMAMGAMLFNSFSPQFAQGMQLSKNVKINGISRLEATFSTVDLKIVGAAGTVINSGQVEDATGNKWNLPTIVTIPLAGEISVTAISDVGGAITAGSGTITIISTPTLGWQTVTNLLAATSGRDAETDSELRTRQRTSTAQPSQTVFEGVLGGVLNIDGVTKAALYENDTDLTDTNGLPPHSISTVVKGGDTQTIGEIVSLRKTIGCGTYGTTAVNVVDTMGVLNIINFYRPTETAIKVNITVQALIGWSSSYIADIQNAIIAHIEALDIGEDVIFVKLYVPANLAGTTAFETFDITALTIAKNAGVFGTTNIALSFNELATIASTDIVVTVI